MTEITIAKEALAALPVLTGLCPRNAKIPITGQIRLVLRGTTLQLSANNLDRQVTLTAESEGAGDWAVTADAHLFGAVVSAARGPLTLKPRDEGGITVSTAGATHHIAGLPAEDFPDLAEDPNPKHTSLKADTLAFLLSATAHAISQDLARPMLCGAYITERGGGIRVTAADGHQMAVADASVHEIEPGLAGVVSRDCVTTVKQILARASEVKLALGEKLVLEGGELRLVSLLIDSTYPDYERVIPAPDAPDFCSVRTADLDAGVAQVLPYLDKATGARFTVQDGQLVIAARNSDGRGDAKATIAAEAGDEGVETGLNVSYVAAMLAALPKGVERLALKQAGPGGPVRIDPAERDDFVAVIMPMRV